MNDTGEYQKSHLAQFATRGSVWVSCHCGRVWMHSGPIETVHCVCGADPFTAHNQRIEARMQEIRQRDDPAQALPEVAAATTTGPASLDVARSRSIA